MSFQLVQWGDYTHYHAGTGMTSALILCALHNDLVPGSWPTSDIQDVPTRWSAGSSTIVISTEPPTCKWCMEVAAEFDEISSKDLQKQENL